MKEQTHIITLAEARREYLNNRAFREMLNSGCFIYIENSYFLNSDDYIVKEEAGYIPTEYARLHLDECTLLFEDREIIKYLGSATRGANGQKASIEIKQRATYSSQRQKKELLDDIKQIRKAMIKQFDLQTAHQKTCWQRIFEIISSKGTTTSGMFAQKTDLIPKVYDKAKNNDSSIPGMKTIITIAAAYDLDISTTEELLNLAGHSFSPTSREHDCYRFILTTMYGYKLSVKNEVLHDEGFEPLGSKVYSKKDD